MKDKSRFRYMIAGCRQSAMVPEMWTKDCGTSPGRRSERKGLPSVHTLLFISAAWVLLIAHTWAANIGPNGYNNDFATQPVLADWSCLSVDGDAGDITNAAALDAAVALLTATAIANPVTSDAANPPTANTNAVWSSSGHYLQTRPTNNKFTALMASLVNNTGWNLNTVSFGYTFSQVGAAAEQVAGHRVYYSLTGASHSWSNITALSSATPGALTATLNVPWTNDGTLYLLWADDNGSPSPDAGNQLDNFSVTVVPPPLPVQVLAANQTLLGTAANVTAALALATNGCTVRIPAGTYSAAYGEVFPLRVTNAITLEAATVTTPPNVTVQGDGQHTVLLIAVPGVTVRGLRLTGGMGSEGIYRKDGGGICIFVNADAEGSVWIEHCLVDNNLAGYDVTYDGSGAGIYCGGTWCTCFEICITNCVVRSNLTYGNGAGIYCGLLSRVVIANTLIEANAADDRGGGVCVDSYALTLLKDGTRVERNQARGDTRYERPKWGGKGGGVFYDASAVCEIRDSSITSNTARFYGGGIFTMSSLTDAGTQEDSSCGAGANPPPRFFGTPTLYNSVIRSMIAYNAAQWSGGGVFLREQAYLAFDRTTLFWNEANEEDGGGVYVEGGATLGAMAEFAPGCLLEGNECTGRGGGVFVGSAGVALFDGSWLLGNSSLDNGGAVQADPYAWLSLTNSLITYNNSARGRGGAFALASGATVDLQRCSVVGNFAPWERSGLHLAAGVTATITNSILWRNAGGSITTNGAVVKLGYSLDEDLPAAGGTLLTGSPGYVAWGTNDAIYLNAGATSPGQGTATQPYQSLQFALTNGFSLRLASASPCRHAASDGGFIGADTGIGGAAGHTNATLKLLPGGYDIRGRNISLVFGLQGSGASSTFITNAVFGYMENAFVNDLAITGEEWFGGIVTRADVRFGNASVSANQALADGGGIYVAAGTCLLSNSVVSANIGFGRGGGVWVADGLTFGSDRSVLLGNDSVSHGGGLFLSPQVTAWLTNVSLVRANANNYRGLSPSAEGGGVYAVNAADLLVLDSGLDLNASASHGGGLRARCPALLANSWISTNTSTLADGGGAYSSGALTVTNCLFHTNTVPSAGRDGGGLFIRSGSGLIQDSRFDANWAADGGGGLLVAWEATRFQAQRCEFTGNWANQGGGAYLNNCNASALDLVDCAFNTNRANWAGGLDLDNARAQVTRCTFTRNFSYYDGGGGLSSWAKPLFTGCTFTENRADADGGAQRCYGGAATYVNCRFDGNSAGGNGGTMAAEAGDASQLYGCTSTAARAAGRGGGLYATDTSNPWVQDTMFIGNQADMDGGAAAFVAQSSGQFRDVTISGCTAVLGGGVYGDGVASLLFERCVLSGNRARSALISADGGGGCFTSNAVVRFTCSWITNNEATDDGGGFSAAGQASVSLTNTFVASNHAVNSGGGAHFTARSAGTFQNCTIVDNAVDISNGGGIYVEANCAINADSSIVYANQPDGVAPQHGNAVVNYSCLQEPWPGTGNISREPLLDPATLLLLDASPCIDAGNPSPLLVDASVPPGKGAPRNDMGASGGPRNGCAPATTPQWLIPPVGTWKYWDRGEPPPANWRELTFDDGDWLSGFAKLGAGDDGEVTTVSVGTNAAQRYITTWFRRPFFVTNPTSIHSLEARLMCDDGAVLYLNGAEAARYNMRAGSVAFTTLAATSVSGADENRWISLALPPGLLVPGWNVLAVEVHQAAADSGDLGFDLQLASVETFAVLPPSRAYFVNDDSRAGDVFTAAVGDDRNPGTVPELPLRYLSTVFARYTLSPGDVIYVDTGVYADSATVPSGTRGVTLRGAGMDRSVVDGGQATNCLVLDHVLGMTIKDLTLRRGKATKLLYGTGRGGALLCSWSDLDLANLGLRDSTADYGGGAWVDRSDVILSNVVFSGNMATNQGGGLFLDFTQGTDARHLVTNCMMTGNSAYGGAGLCVLDGVVQGCTMSSNVASQYGGGGVFVQRSRVESCLVAANRANYSAGLDISDRVAVRDCTIVSNTAALDGGGLRLWSSTPMSNCVFIGNLATNAGGGANLWHVASVQNCTFGANRAAWGGGLTLDGNASALNCLFTNNTASTESGAVRAWNATLVSNCLFVGNLAPSAGGLSLHGNARAQQCVITNNTATDAGGLRLYENAGISDSRLAGNVATNWGGGAIVHHQCFVQNCWIGSNRATGGGGLDMGNTAMARDCVISNNTATSDGGGAFLWDSSSISNCTVVDNAALNRGGGGIYSNGSGRVHTCRVLNNQANGWAGGGVHIVNGGTVRNSLLTGNAAARGGGLYLSEGTAESCTIVDNAATDGGGLYVEAGGGITNAIIYLNQAAKGSNWFKATANGVFAYSCTAPAVSGTGNIIADPRFLDWPAGDFRLATNSPCIDSGVVLGWMTDATDLADNARVLGVSADIGAYETLLPWGDTDGDGLPDWWEWAYAQSAAALTPEGDPDSDGASNMDEFVAGTDPTNPEDVFKVRDIRVDPASHQAVIAWDVVSGHIYTVFTSSAARGPWTNQVAEIPAASTGLQSFTNRTVQGPNHYLRVGVRTQP